MMICIHGFLFPCPVPAMLRKPLWRSPSCGSYSTSSCSGTTRSSDWPVNRNTRYKLFSHPKFVAKTVRVAIRPSTLPASCGTDLEMICQIRAVMDRKALRRPQNLRCLTLGWFEDWYVAMVLRGYFCPLRQPKIVSWILYKMACS